MFNLSKLEISLVGSIAVLAILFGLVQYGEHSYKVKQEAQWSQAVKDKQAELDKAKAAGLQLTQQLKDAEAKQTIVYKTVTHYIPKKEIVYVNQVPVSGPFTISLNDLFVLNSSTQGSLSLPSAAFGVAGSPADSGVTLQAVLGNYATNAAVCLHNTNQLQALIDWYKASR